MGRKAREEGGELNPLDGRNGCRQPGSTPLLMEAHALAISSPLLSMWDDAPGDTKHLVRPSSSRTGTAV